MNLLYVVGIGPGGAGGMTYEAKAALDGCQLIVGYKTYVDLAKESFPNARFFSNGMRGESERCRHALESAASGATTAVICSGDSGAYGMAALVLELAQEYPAVEVRVIAGVTAALSGAALLGAPLTSDFAAVSLSNLIERQERIDARLRAAAQADFAIALYNPMSRGRPDSLSRACDILLEFMQEQRPCGFARNIGRGGQESRVLTLGELKEERLDMFCTAFVGSSSTRIMVRQGRKLLVSPRGYKL